jgi:transcriptional regulator with XRE-family HTH domain
MFKERFEEKRKALDLSFARFSKQTGISSSILFGYSKGKLYPEDKHLRKVCQVLGLDPSKEAKAIEAEKKQNIFSIAQYPDIRGLILKTYAHEYSRLTQKPFSLEELEKEFSNIPFHPIEEKLIEVVNNNLQKNKIISSSENFTRDKYSAEQKRQLFNKIITEWGYIPSSKLLIVTFKGSKGISSSVSYKMRTKVEWEESASQPKLKS